jgi:hypothetical protein
MTNTRKIKTTKQSVEKEIEQKAYELDKKMLISSPSSPSSCSSSLQITTPIALSLAQILSLPLSLSFGSGYIRCV